MRCHKDFALGLATGALLVVLAYECPGPFVQAREKQPAPVQRDNDELAKLYDEDQADRMPKGGKPIDWTVVGPRDRRREDRVKTLYTADQIRTGKDYERAAMVLQHAAKPEGYLLAHEFCVVALAKGQ